MQLHELKPKYKPKGRKRVGRGGKRGTYSGRGIKGQKSRSGHRIRPAIRDIMKRIPKLRGSVGKDRKTKIRRGVKLHRYKIKPQIINIAKLEKKFKSGEKVTPQTLIEKGLIDLPTGRHGKVKGQIPEVKILGKGKLTKKLEIEGCKMSKSVEKMLK